VGTKEEGGEGDGAATVVARCLELACADPAKTSGFYMDSTSSSMRVADRYGNGFPDSMQVVGAGKYG
jgi:hypothetical protein